MSSISVRSFIAGSLAVVGLAALLGAGGPVKSPTGIAPDLMEGARIAVTGMIELLTHRHGLSPVEAYMLCSVCADLRISEIVDAPDWIVSFYFPKVVFA